MMLKFRRLLTFVILLLNYERVDLEASTCSVSVSANPVICHIGDEIRYSIIIERPENWTVLQLPVGANLGSFEIRDFYLLPPVKKEKGKVKQEYKFNLAIYQLGEFEIPSLDIFLSDPSGKTNTLKVEKVKISVVPISDTNSETLADLKPQIRLKDNLLIWKIVLGLIFILTGILLYFYLKKRKKITESLDSSQPYLPPHVEAFAKLDEIEKRGLPQDDKIKEYYSEVMDVLRVFIARRFGILTMERTSEEIIDDLERFQEAVVIIEDLKKIFELADMVKFAKLIPSKSETAGLIPEAKSIIERLIPPTVIEEEEKK